MTVEVPRNEDISEGRTEKEKKSVVLSAEEEKIVGAKMYKRRERRGVVQPNIDSNIILVRVKQREGGV